jgi:hypothetical protein
MEHLVRGNVTLARGSLLRIEDGREMRVTVLAGGIWLTQEGDRRDRYVGAGDSCLINARGLTLISALGRSLISLASPYHGGFAQRIDLVRAHTGELQSLFAAPSRWSALRARMSKTWAGWFAPGARPTTAAL